MVESDAIPRPVTMSSDESTSLDKVLEVNIGPSLSSEAQDIFKAAHYFSSKDREEARLERERVMQLSNFISAHGFSANDVNDFISVGKLSSHGHTHQVFDKSSPEAGEPSGARPSILGGQLAPVYCVGEEPQLASGPPSPLLMSPK